MEHIRAILMASINWFVTVWIYFYFENALCVTNLNIKIKFIDQTVWLWQEIYIILFKKIYWTSRYQYKNQCFSTHYKPPPRVESLISDVQ